LRPEASTTGWHVEAVHPPPWQSCPQAPQLRGSEARSAHPPVQSVVPPSHAPASPPELVVLVAMVPVVALVVLVAMVPVVALVVVELAVTFAVLAAAPPVPAAPVEALVEVVAPFPAELAVELPPVELPPVPVGKSRNGTAHAPAVASPMKPNPSRRFTSPPSSPRRR
jgi:hypothetical protein